MDIRNKEERATIHPVYPARNKKQSEQIFSDQPRNDPRQRHQNNQDHPPEQSGARAPIGIFDSGAGGLTILSALRQQLPNENFVYFGDTAYCPYGVRPEDEIIQLSSQACNFLIEQGVKLIVVACNTASQAALSALRDRFSLPFIGVVPAVKPAARITRNGKIGIAATNRTVQATYLHHLIEDFASDIQVYTVGCPELVLLVEQGRLVGSVVEETLHTSLQPLIENDVDVVVLGCTHFPPLRPAIERVLGPHVQIIDSGDAIARRTQAILAAEGLVRPAEQTGGEVKIYCSGDGAAFSQVASAILGYPVQAQQAQDYP